MAGTATDAFFAATCAISCVVDRSRGMRFETDDGAETEVLGDAAAVVTRRRAARGAATRGRVRAMAFVTTATMVSARVRLRVSPRSDGRKRHLSSPPVLILKSRRDYLGSIAQGVSHFNARTFDRRTGAHSDTVPSRALSSN